MCAVVLEGDPDLGARGGDEMTNRELRKGVLDLPNLRENLRLSLLLSTEQNMLRKREFLSSI